MAKDTLLTHLLDLFDPLAEVTAKRMFGAHGLFRHGWLIAPALVEDALRSSLQ